MTKIYKPVDPSSGLGVGSDTEIVCACVNMSYAKLIEECATTEGASFEVLLQKTGAGQKCTACLLDLEYYFSQIAQNSKIFARKKNKTKERRLSYRRQIYRIIDQLSPSESYTLRDWTPVISGPGIKQWLSISNHHLLFSRKVALAPCAIKLVLYDSEGQCRYKDQVVVNPGQHFRMDISAYLEKTSGLNIGSLRIERTYLEQGVRGATRPHIEIDTEKGTSSLHTQGTMGGYSSFMHLPYSPDERLFFAAINCQNSPIRMFFTYPLEGGTKTQESVTVPAFGARLHEINPIGKVDPSHETFNIELSAEYPARRRCLLIIADRNLSKLSITHP